MEQANAGTVSLVDRWRSAGRAFWKGKTGYLFILPVFVFFGTFTLYPSIRSIALAFMKYEYLRADRRYFIGVANFTEWLLDSRVLETFLVSLRFALMYVPVVTLYALVVALLLDRVRNSKMSAVYRTILYFPVVLPGSIVFYMWKWMYDPSWGVFNHLLIDVLRIPWPWTGWLSDPATALPSLALMNTWRLMGMTMILFLVGLNNISNELIEAARIDGASEWRVIWHITLPLLKPIFLIILVLRIQVLGMIVEPLIMTEGSPLRTTMTYGLQAYYITFKLGNWRMGYGTTWFLMLGVVSSILSFIAWRLLRTEEMVV